VAAQNDNYIGVAMGLDVTDLKAGLADANKQIQLANSEFKAASSGMDDWTKSTEGLTAKVKQLDTVLTLQKKKLAGMQAEYDKVVKSQGENSEAARKLKVQMNNQQAVVNATEKEFKNYSETLKEAEAGNIDLTKVTLKNGKALKKQGDEAKDSGSKLDGLKSVAGGVAKGLLAIGAAAVAAIGGFLSLAESTREFREDMAKLDSAFSASKLGADSAANTYKTLFGAIGESDTAVEAAQQIALLANSEEEAAKWAELATGVVGTFGDALKPETFFEAANETIKLGEATGAFTQMLEGTGASVDEFNAGLAACNTEEEKQAYMLEISNSLLGAAGAAYNETAKDIIEAREAEAELTQAMADLGAIAEPIMTTLKLIAVDLLKTIQPFVELIGEGLRGAIEGAAGATDKLAEGLGGIINALVERLMNMLPTVLNVILQLIPTIANTLLAALPQLLDVVLDLVTQIINLLAELAPQIIAKIVEIIPQLIQSIIDALPQILEAIITLVMAIVAALPTIITTLINALPQLIQSIVDFIIQAIPMIIDAAIQLFMAIIDALPVIIQAIIQNLPTVINTIIDGLLDALPLLLQAAIQLFMAIIDALPTIIKLLVNEIPQIVTTIINTLLSRLPDLIQGAIKLFMGLLEAIPKIQIELIKNIPQIIATIVSGLAQGVGEMAKAGLNLLKGIWEGIKGGAKWLKDKITGFAGNVAGWFKKVFKIESPSKLMADEVGEYIGEGIGVGVLDSIPTVKKQLGKFAGFVQDNLGDIKSGLSINANGIGGGYAGGRGNTVVNAGMTVNYNGALSRKQLKQLENDQYAMVKMRLKAEGAI
jgi:hypothetical protein